MINSDYCAWVTSQVELLKKGELMSLDIQHLIEEIESLGNSERRALESHLENILMHMLKVKYQPEKHTRSWDLSIKESRYRANRVLKHNPSLKRELMELSDSAYFSARLRAEQETGLDEAAFPEIREWNLDQILGDL